MRLLLVLRELVVVLRRVCRRWPGLRASRRVLNDGELFDIGASSIRRQR